MDFNDHKAVFQTQKCVKHQQDSFDWIESVVKKAQVKYRTNTTFSPFATIWVKYFLLQLGKMVDSRDLSHHDIVEICTYLSETTAHYINSTKIKFIESDLDEQEKKEMVMKLMGEKDHFFYHLLLQLFSIAKREDISLTEKQLIELFHLKE